MLLSKISKTTPDGIHSLGCASLKYICRCLCICIVVVYLSFILLSTRVKDVIIACVQILPSNLINLVMISKRMHTYSTQVVSNGITTIRYARI